MAPVFKTPAVGKKAPKTPKKASTVRKIKKVETYASYIYKVLKQVHLNTGISKQSMSILNSFINDIFERLALQSSHLTRILGKPTLSKKVLESAVKLVLPGELLKHAICEGRKAVGKYEATK